MKNKTKYNLGDAVQSSPDSCDVQIMKAKWVAVIHEYKGQNEKGEQCYDTLGFWKPIKDADGNVTDFWKKNPPSTEPTLRQLLHNHLVKI